MKAELILIDVEIADALKAYDRACDEQARCGLHIRKLVDARSRIAEKMNEELWKGLNERAHHVAENIARIHWPAREDKKP